MVNRWMRANGDAGSRLAAETRQLDGAALELAFGDL